MLQSDLCLYVMCLLLRKGHTSPSQAARDYEHAHRMMRSGACSAVYVAYQEGMVMMPGACSMTHCCAKDIEWSCFKAIKWSCLAHRGAAGAGS